MNKPLSLPAAVGDTIEGTCVTMGWRYTGTVVRVVSPAPGSGESRPRYHIGEVSYSGPEKACGWPAPRAAIVHGISRLAIAPAAA